MSETRVIKSTCGMCSAACGIKVHVKKNRVVTIKGDPESPINKGAICPKGKAAVELCYHPDRIRHPLKRIGQKGEGKWEKISWDEAIDIIAAEMQETKDKYGPESVVFAQGSAKGLIDDYNERFANVFGSPNYLTTGHVCFLPRFFASKVTYGAFTVPDYENPPDCIISWGVNLAETRMGEHYRMSRKFKKGMKIIVIDPMKTALTKRADVWLKVRPGTDLALALGMIHVIINENRYNKSFVKNHTIGFNRLKAHVQVYSPGKVSHITWIPEKKIKEAARVYSNALKASIQWGNAIDHGINSFQTARALSILRAITGNLDIPGGDLMALFPLSGVDQYDVKLENKLHPEKRKKRIGFERNLFPMFRRILPNDLTDTIFQDRPPYPVRNLYLHGSNPLISFTNSKKACRAFKKIKFFAVSDFFITPTAALADFILPAATFLEYDSIIIPPYYPFVQVQQKAISVDDCRSDYEIKNRLAKSLKLDHYFPCDMDAFFNKILKPIGITFNKLKKVGTISGENIYRKYEKTGFDTPSGQVELYSKQLENMGFQPIPKYIEPIDTPLSHSKLAIEYPLIMTSRKSIYFVHSGERQIKSLRNRHPEPIVRIHSQTANDLMIKNGDWVFIETKKGRIKQKALLSDDLDPRVICVDYGWWFPEKENSDLYGWAESNLNILTNDREISPETGSSNLRGILCKIYKE